MEKIKKSDFIELEYSGRVEDGEIFDTNIKSEAEKIGLKIEDKPFVICIGQGMILKSIDDFLIDKELDKKYNLKLEPEKAFGFRKPNLVKTMPLSVFSNQKINPQPGMVFQFDNMLGRISSVSGGRIMVDFNNPLANKTVIYDLKPKKIIKDINEKIKILINLYFRQDLKFEVIGKFIEIELDEKLKPIIEMFKEKFKEILDLELKIKEKPKA